MIRREAQFDSEADGSRASTRELRRLGEPEDDKIERRHGARKPHPRDGITEAIDNFPKTATRP